MQSSAANVADYIAEAPAERRAALKKLRALCRKLLKGAKEGIAYGMPAYTRDGTLLIAFASQKNFLALYGCGTDLRKNHPEAAAKLDCGKGCIRFPKPEQMDFDLIAQLIAEKSAARA